MTLEFKWTVSKGRDTYGYNICTLYADGTKVARCNGGGYDMRGTCLGDFVARKFAPRLLALKPEDMPEQSHWERADPIPRVCRSIACILDENNAKDMPDLGPDVLLCPKCGGETSINYNAGKRIDEGRYFYGLSFHDPKFDPSKAVIGEDCHDRTLGAGAEGKTVEQAEKDGESFGLERYQAFYSASSKHSSERHIVPLIDGACGQSSVEQIMKAIGLELEYMPTRGRRDSLYQLRDKRSE